MWIMSNVKHTYASNIYALRYLKQNNHKLNRTITTQRFVDEIENPLNKSKGNTTPGQPNP
jgi:hypothetical protein